MTDREELRKLAEAATPGPWDCYRPHPNYRAYSVDRVMPGGYLGEDVATTGDVHAEKNGAYIAAANPAAVLDLLDQLNAAESKLAAVREIHSPAWWYDEFCDDPSCEQEHVEIDVGDLYHAHPSWLVCECCSGGDLSETDEPAPWPCPTTRALDEGTDHE